jgi:hypothetical protein
LLELDANGWELEELGFVSLQPPLGTGSQDSTREIDVEDWKFAHKCPKCNFEFND